MIEFNKHPAGRISNVCFGLCQIADGLVRALSLGHLHSTFCLMYSHRQTKLIFTQLKKAKHASQ